jgi:hypothetical protein
MMPIRKIGFLLLLRGYIGFEIWSLREMVEQTGPYNPLVMDPHTRGIREMENPDGNERHRIRSAEIR